MPRPKADPIRQALRAIPKEHCETIVDWLYDSATRADHTAANMRAANKRYNNPAVEATAVYWSSVGTAARFLATQILASSARPRKAKVGKEDERSK